MKYTTSPRKTPSLVAFVLSILFVMAACSEPNKPNNAGGGGGGTTTDTIAPPTITTQPASQSIVEGSTASLAVVVTEVTGVIFTYQWQTAAKGSKVFNDIAGATAATYTPTLTAADNGTQYRVVVTATNTAKKTSNKTSDIATVTITFNPARVSFASLTDSDKTIIGMREFLLTVSFSGIADGMKDSLDFIVSESATAPDYETKVKTNPARMRRAFTNAKASREVYFSTTEGLQLKADGSLQLTANASYSVNVGEGQKAFGVMMPNTAYYVHVYYNGQPVKVSPPITTLNFPTALPLPLSTKTINGVETTTPLPLTEGGRFNDAYFRWQMSMWQVSPTDVTFRILEHRQGEVVLLPVRAVTMYDIDNPTKVSMGCITRTYKVGVLYVGSNSYQFSATTEATGKAYSGDIDALVDFINSPGLPNNVAGKSVHDIMFVVNTQNGSSSTLEQYELEFQCIVPFPLTAYTEAPYFHRFNIVTE